MMKYTNYIINGNILDLDQLIAEKPGWKQLSIVASLPVAFMGLGFISATIPFTVMIDGYRSLKMRYYIYLKKYKRDKYYSEVFSSLDISQRYGNNLKIILQKGYNEIFMNSNIQISNIPMAPIKYKLQYILSKGSYIVTDQQMNTFHTLDRSYFYVKRTLREKLTW